MNIFLKYYLPFFVFAYLLITFVLPSVRVYRETGINPVTFGKSDNAHDFIGAVMKIITGLLVVAVLFFSFGNAYGYLNPFENLDEIWLKFTGLFIIHTALIWIVVAQHQMKQSWRIGIDAENKTKLITDGLFSISRNPVFLGMVWTTAGIFLILPNAVTFLVAVTSYIVIQIQIRLEEEHLLKQHGTVYSDYKQRVKRLM